MAVSATEIFVQTREPATLFLVNANQTIQLATSSVEDTGHAIFHANSGGFLACAGCHPEGGDDGRVWNFDQIGPRRSQNLHGTIAGTAPYHWNGDQQDFPTLIHTVFTGRMSGGDLPSDEQAALQHFVEAIPELPNSPPADSDAVQRGKVLFDGQGGCSGCHNGAKYTNNQTLDVGTGGKFQVPSLLGVGHRAPYLHDGCAATLNDRFGPCGGGDQHGFTTQLSADQISDLIAYLETL